MKVCNDFLVFGGRSGSTNEANIDPKRGFKIAVHLGIAFYSIFFDFRSQGGVENGQKINPTGIEKTMGKLRARGYPKSRIKTLRGLTIRGSRPPGRGWGER